MARKPLSSEPRVVGQTAGAGFQIGVRRTLPISADRAWSFLTSPEGLRLWIGVVPPLSFQIGEAFASEEGVTGQFRVVKETRQLRLRWKRQSWNQSSTLQIRLLPAKSGGTTVSFHQENLDGPNIREEMKAFWEEALNRMIERTVGPQA